MHTVWDARAAAVVSTAMPIVRRGDGDMASPKSDFAKRWRSAVTNLRLETERVQATADDIPSEVALVDGHRSRPALFDPLCRHIHAFASYTTALNCVQALLVERKH